MKDYDVLLFDLVGVLVTGNESVSEIMLGWTGLNDAQLWAFWLKSPTVRDFDSGRINSLEFASRLVAELNIPIAHKEYLKVFRTWLAGLEPGTETLLTQLRQTYRVACLSNINEVHWPLIRDDFGLAGLLDDYFLSYKMGMLKPDKEVFRHVIAELNCPPERILFFDDNAVNVETAKAEGLHALHTRGIGEVQEILATLRML